jgi:hypothetical protein
MQFTKTPAALLVGVASLVGFSNAAAIPISEISNVKRDWTAPTGFQGVKMSNSAGIFNAGLGLYTEGLVPCIGVIATSILNDLICNICFMAHLTGSWSQIKTRWSQFEALVGQSGLLQNKRAWVSIPTTVGMDSEMRTTTEMAIGNVVSRVIVLAGGQPEQANHPFSIPQSLPDGSMWVTSDNQVFIGGLHYP